MLAKNRQIEQIENVLISNKLLEKFNINRVGIFGSAARGEQSIMIILTLVF